MDRIIIATKDSPQANTIKFHFGGKYAREIISNGCPHKHEIEEDFLSVGVLVKNQKSIQQGLLAFVQGEMLEGDNAYLCEKCDKKVDIMMKRTCIKKLPRYLILPM
jgi:ubiquitin carboxyl-terminal hydrolase 9/24